MFSSFSDIQILTAASCNGNTMAVFPSLHHIEDMLFHGNVALMMPLRWDLCYVPVPSTPWVPYSTVHLKPTSDVSGSKLIWNLARNKFGSGGDGLSDSQQQHTLTGKLAYCKLRAHSSA